MEDIARLFKLFGDVNRLRILKLLERRKMCVCELADIIGIAQPSVSRHLKLLLEDQLIEREQDGLWTNYYLKITGGHAKVLYSNVSMWMEGEDLVKNDADKALNIDRAVVCVDKRNK